MTKSQLISLSTSVALLATVFMLVPAVSADGCVTEYGNGQYGQVTCPPTDLTIDKKVSNPITGIFVDNLLAGDAAFSPASEVLYSLTITNSGTTTFTTVQVTDAVPDQLTNPHVDEPDQTKVTNVTVTGNVLKFVLISELKPEQQVEVRIKAQVKSASTFDVTKNLHCDITNRAVVTAGDRADDDEAKLCVQTNVLGKSTLPSAGPQDYLPLMPFAAMGILGIALFLRKSPITG